MMQFKRHLFHEAFPKKILHNSMPRVTHYGMLSTLLKYLTYFLKMCHLLAFIEVTGVNQGSDSRDKEHGWQSYYISNILGFTTHMKFGEGFRK